MTKEISNTDDIIDSRDVIARIEELESELETAHQNDFEDGTTGLAVFADWLVWHRDQDGIWGDEAKELLALRSLAEDGEGLSDWRHGETLIREDHFEDYARELAESIGAIPNDSQWPCTCIDWERAARELRMDYTSVEFGDVTYYARG